MVSALRRSTTSASLRGAGSRRIRINPAKHAGLANVLEAENQKATLASKYDAKSGRNSKRSAAMSRAVSEAVISSKAAPEIAPAPTAVPSPTTLQEKAASILDEYDSDGQRRCPPRTDLMRSKQRPPGELDWVALMHYNSAVVALDQRLDHEAAGQARTKFRHDLDLQMQAKHEQQRKEAAIKSLELQRENQHFERIQHDVELEQAERKQHILQEKEVRMYQIRTNVQKKEMAKEVRRQLNQRMLERMRQEQVKMKAEAAARLAREKAKLAAVKKQNDEMQAQKRREKAEQEQAEIARQKAYAAMVEAQEQARADFYQKKKERQEANLEQLVKSTEKEQAAAIALERKIRAAQEEYDRKQAEAERTKELQRKQMREAIAVELKRQVEAHAQQKAEQVRIDLEYSEIVKQRLAQIDERNAAEIRQHKQKLMEQAEILNRQMTEMEQRKQKERAAMSETEMKMNRQILDKVRRGEIVTSYESGIRPRPY